MEENKKIKFKGIDAAGCCFEESEVPENVIELLDPENYPYRQRNLIDELNKKLQEANHKCHMALLREEMYAKGFDAGMFIAEFDEAENMVSFEFTDAVRRMLGYDGTEDLPDEFDSWVKLLLPEERDTVVKLFWDAVKRHRQLPDISHAEYRMRKKDGSLIWITGAGRFVCRGDGSLKVYMGCYREVTAEHEKAEYIHSLGEYSRVMSSTGFGMWHIILKQGAAPRMQANDKMAQLLGVEGKNLAEEELYKVWHENIVHKYVPSVKASLDKMKTGHFSESTYQWAHPAKGIIYVRCGGTAEKLEDGTHVFSGYYGDVTNIIMEEKRKKEEIKELNARILIDALTGVNNRNAADNYMDSCFAKEHKNLQIVMIDLDCFKEINDTYGHQSGDRALKLLAKAFKANLTQNAFFARYGGDEFLLVSTSEDSEEINRILKNTKKDLKEMCLKEGDRYDIDFSYGIAQKTPEMKTLSDLIAAADAAMYRAKEAKKADKR